MARETYTTLRRSHPQVSVAGLASGKNPDGTDFTLPVSLSGTGTVSVAGGPTTATNSTNAVTNSSSTIQALNASRKACFISNDSTSANPVWISFEDTAVVGTGIELVPGAGMVVHGDLFTGAIKAISAGTATVGTTEV